ncbi:hypothetical protein FJ208_01860 [Candidatus Gribaldobacteria bacterium]|nr:hypothetical protein [Candidatus Gribaldobacteria bacterium]
MEKGKENNFKASYWHQDQWAFLMVGVKQGQMSHSFIFSGEDGLGKKGLALELFENLNKGRTLRYPDLLEVSPEKGLISIEKIKNLQKGLALKPFAADFKAVLINQAQTMNKDAQNCLLKTLEEPTEKTIFILLTPQKDFLLKTILSRCQTIRFFPLKEEKMMALFSFFKDKENFSEVLFLSQGLPQKALSLFESQGLYNKEKSKAVFLTKVFSSKLPQLFNLSKKIFQENKDKEKPFDFLLFLKEAIHFFRLSLLAKEGLICSPFLKENTFNFNLKMALRSVEELQFLSENYNINKRLAFETLMLKLFQ